jgi:hypothetical protein
VLVLLLEKTGLKKVYGFFFRKFGKEEEPAPPPAG